MEILSLHFRLTDDPPAEDPDRSQFRQRLYRRLEAVLTASGSGRWRGSRYAHGEVIVFLAVSDTREAMDQIRAVLKPHGLNDHLADCGQHCQNQRRQDQQEAVTGGLSLRTQHTARSDKRNAVMAYLWQG